MEDLETLRRRIKELRRTILIDTEQLAQKLQAQAINRALDCGVDARIRELDRRNWELRSILSEKPEPRATEPRVRVTKSSTVSDADWYMRDFARRLELAKRRNAVKEAKRHFKPGRRGIIRQWLELGPCRLRALIAAVRVCEKGV